MTTIGFIRGSGLPVASKTLSTIDSQVQSMSILNATAEHGEKSEANHPAVFDFKDSRLTGKTGFPPEFERRCIAGFSWKPCCWSLAHGASSGSQNWQWDRHASSQ